MSHTSPELFWLGLVCALTGLMWIPYIVNRIQELGPPKLAWYPPPDPAPQAAWAARAVRAHMNALENLAIFAPLLLSAHAMMPGHPTLVAAAQCFASARLAHYVVYLVGMPIVLRTLTFLAGVAAQMAVAYLLLTH